MPYVGPERVLNSGRLARNIGDRPEWPPTTNGRASSAANHIIPDRAVQNVTLLRVAHENNLYDFDGADNGVFLPTTPEAAAVARADPDWTQPTPIHNSGHPQYSAEVRRISEQAQSRLENRHDLDLDNMTPDEIEALSPEIKQDLAQTIEMVRQDAAELLTDPDFVVDEVLQ